MKKIKRILAMFLCMVVLLATMPMFNILTASAETHSGICGVNLTWELNDNGTLTISGTGPMTDFESNGNGGATYANNCFTPWRSFYNEIKKIVICDGVTTIGNYSFCGCENLSNVSLPNTLTYIGRFAFMRCKKLKEFNMPNSVTGISDAVFYYSGIKNIKFSENMPYIVGNTFAFCDIDEITLPKNLVYIDVGFLYGATCQKVIYEGDNWAGISFGDYYSNPLRTAHCYYHNGKRVDTIYVPDNSIINSYAFMGYENLNIYIPQNVTSISDNAFLNCKSLTVFGASNSYAETYARNNNIPFAYINAFVSNPTVHSYYSEEVSTSQEGINLDFSDAKCDIDLGSINGPSINILGHKFDLINMKSECSFDFKMVSASYKVDNTKKTVKVILGYGDKAKAELKEGGTYNKEYNDLKELYKYVSGKNYKDWNGYQKLRSQKIAKLVDGKGSLGLNAKIKVTGYLEFSYETGHMIATESGIIVIGEIGVTLTYQPNFFYITTGLKGSADASVGFALEQNGKIAFKSLATNFKLSANVGVGIGSKALNFYVEGGLTGTIGVSLSSDFVNTANYKVNLTGSLYLEAKAVLFTRKKSWDFYNQDLKNKTINLKSINRDLFVNPSETFTAVGRKYNYVKTQNTRAGSKGLLRGSLQDNTVFSYNDIYPYAMPIYLSLIDGRSVVVWVGDDGTKTDNNRTSIMYSICEDRVWSQPTVLQDNGTYNDMPCAYTDGENVYLVWQRAKNIFEDEIEVEQAASQLDLFYSVFDGAAFSSPVCITNYKNDIYEDTMSIYSADGTQVISWRQNDENAIFDDVGNDSLRYRLCENGNWQDVTQVITTDERIDEQVCAIENSVPVLYYITTGETSTLYRYDTVTKITTQIACGDNVSSLSIVNGKVYYLCDEYLFFYNGEPTQVTDLQLNNYQLVTNGEKEALFTLRSAGLKNALYSCERNSDSESFGDLTLFADYDSNIRNYYAVMDSNGLTSVAVNSVAVNEENIQAGDDVYGLADLFITEKENYYDIGIDYFSYDSNDVSPSHNLEFTYQINNSGNVTQNSFIAKLYKEDGSLIKSEYVDCELEPGQSETFAISYLLSENIGKEEITLTIEADNDNFISNNTTSTTIGLADVLLSDLSVYASNNNTAVLKGYVRNAGYDSAENTHVSISRLINGEKAEINSIDVGVLEANQSKEFVIELPEDMFMTDSADVMNGIYLDVSTSSDEALTSNNDDKIVYDTLATGVYDDLTYYLYNNGELRFEGSGTLHYYNTQDNPFIIYKDKIDSIHLDSSISCQHYYEADKTEVVQSESGQKSVCHICKICSKEDCLLKFSGASLTLQNNLKVKFVVQKDLFENYGYKNPYAVFEMNGESITVSDYTVSGEYYIFSFSNIAPDKMSDTITATLHAKYGGVEYISAELKYSIAQYCYSMLGKDTTTDKLRTLLVDLLHYGAASQIYTNHNVKSLADAFLTDEQLAWGTNTDPELTSVTNANHNIINSPSVIWKGVSLNLKDSITMQFVFSSENIDGLTIRVEDQYGSIIKEISKDFVKSGGFYIAKFKGLTAGQMSETVYLTAYSGDKAISNTVAYSIESYAYSKQNDMDVKLATLVKSMMKYGDSAYAYAN